ncbi:hypothetical protein CVS40_0369 [Lucilia cuprina]|nr:hypothetical protein CVS40_0369 [Lucilia cuprina]
MSSSCQSAVQSSAHSRQYRTTGLNLVKPSFNKDKALSSLLRSDADYIDILLTNSGVLSKRDPLFDIHVRARGYYAETIYHLSSTFSGNEVPMGYTVSNQAEGKYFMEIGTNAPYGINGNKHDLLMFEKSGTCKETDIVKPYTIII